MSNGSILKCTKAKKNSDTLALYWIDGNTNEVKWSFQDVAFWSKK